MSEPTFEYVVMHPRYPDDPHRRPFRRSDEDGGDYFDLTPEQQLAWCREWIKDGLVDGMAPFFYVARRSVTPWERIDS